jgi:transposase
VYTIYNRMIDACSKRALPDWYKSTAIQHIRPVEVDALNSRRFWKKWDRVDASQIERIAGEFFRRVMDLEPSRSDCFMFDTTNYFTFMAGKTPSELAQRGKNKEGRNWLRQIGLALLVSRDKRLPLFYREYEGNRHDSKLFLEVIDDVFQAMAGATKDQTNNMTVVFDKGMNGGENIAAIDARRNINFITTYSTHFSEDLIHVGLNKFTPVESERNKQLPEPDRLLAWRTKGEYWGQERAVVVTYNPLTATRQRYSFERKLLVLQEALFEFQKKVHKEMPNWRSKAMVQKRYQEVCAHLHLPDDLYKVELTGHNEKLRFNFRKNHYRIGRHIDRFGKNIIITDRMDWSVDGIVQASLDRWIVEDGFRQSKDDDLVAMMPVRHWTDSKIRCHFFTCIAALTLLRLIELRLRQAGLALTTKTAMRSLHSLHSCLMWSPGTRKPERLLEEPDETQTQILRAFGWKIERGVLQKID